MKRLNKYLADCGVASRRKCDELIEQNRVVVDGEVIQSLGYKIDETEAEVTVDGRKVFLVSKFVYFLLNKPRGYVTTASDEQGRKTVLDLIPNQIRVFPVGRLDMESTGVLLLTNDGDLAYKLTHPKYDVEKIYQVLLNQQITEKHVKKLQTGIMLDDGVTRPCRVKVISKDKRRVELILMEGRNREIRRMLEALDYKVSKLKRTEFATLNLSKLAPGKWRRLTKEEIKKIRTIV
ncbi:rRNA pseudouridine synthase [candidate division KSB1 bacterium]|nr:rRNA pseudouridine synthase [candidate division KSB1 bacterium]